MTPKPLTKIEITQLLANLHSDWQLFGDGNSIRRKFVTQGFSQALLLTNRCATIADRFDHHPDICLGWGYCHITFTTHSKKTLTSKDFECAIELDNQCEVLFSNNG